MLILFIVLIIIMIYVSIFHRKLDNIKKELNINFSVFESNFKSELELISKLIKELKFCYDKEKNILDKIILAKNKLYDKLSKEEKFELSITLSQDIKKIVIIKKKYKELQDNKNFNSIYKEILDLENMNEIYINNYNQLKKEYLKYSRFTIIK